MISDLIYGPDLLAAAINAISLIIISFFWCPLGRKKKVAIVVWAKFFVSLKHELFHCFRVLFSSLEMNVHYLENESTLIFDHYTHFSVENGIFPHYSVENGDFSTL